MMASSTVFRLPRLSASPSGDSFSAYLSLLRNPTSLAQSAASNVPSDADPGRSHGRLGPMNGLGQHEFPFLVTKLSPCYHCSN
jgi:hypothetical protein